MSKIIKLTESQLKTIIENIVIEQSTVKKNVSIPKKSSKNVQVPLRNKSKN